MRSKNIMEGLQVAFTYIGAIIGAGFATGQEIMRFFAVHGADGVKGCVFAGVMLALTGALIVYTVVHERITNYRQYVERLFGGRMTVFFDLLLAFFLYGGLIVMFVAGGSLFTQLFHLPGWTGFLITGVFLYTSLLMGEEGILWLNTAMVPGMILLILFVAGLGTVNYETAPLSVAGEPAGWDGQWLFAAVLYVSYNLILGMTVLSSLDIKKAASGMVGTVIGGGTLGLLAALICLALLRQGSAVSGEEIPMLALSAQVSPFDVWIYSFVLWTAILPTAVGNGFGLFKRLQGRLNWPKPVLALITILPAVIFVDWPLSAAIGTIYPLLGYSGLIFLVAILYRGVRALFKAFCP
jgi:uncharacterized membrane protein YkvI